VTYEDDRRRVQELLRELLVIRSDLSDIEKIISRLRQESMELYNKLDGILDEHY